MKNLACLAFALTLIVSAAAFAEEAPRAARSVHLWYPAPEGVLYYNEMTVEQSHPGSYFMACGFSHGYFGIQEIRDAGDKVVIFSVWEPGEQNDPNTVADERRVQVLFEGDDVRVSRFGNEGTGGKSMFSYDWKIGETYRFLVQAKPDGKRTVYTAWFYLNESSEWKRLASFSTLANGDLLKNYYSFIEDFRRDGDSAREVRRALYGGGWIKTAEGDWIALTHARFTADRTPTMNIDSGVDGARFFLQNGGDTENHTPLQSDLRRPPAGIKTPDLMK